jgi:hypothetical protein
LKYYKSPGTYQILGEMIQAGGEILHFAIQKLIHSICNKKELYQQWKESIIVPLYKKKDKTDCSNYQGIPLLPTSWKYNETEHQQSTDLKKNLLFS